MGHKKPQRIVCLSAESADWLARIDAWEQVVGVTAYFEPPWELPRKPRIAGFSSAHLDTIVALSPDLVIGFSDVQASIAAELIRRGCTVFVTNQRTLAETFDALELLATVVGRSAEARPWLDQLRDGLAPIAPPVRRPKVYFEEWHDPPVSCIGWISELIELAGGEDVFANRRGRAAASERGVTTEEIVDAAPEIMIASWCGAPVDWRTVRERSGWSTLPCVRDERLFEIPSGLILQPGYRLLDGYRRLQAIVRELPPVP